MSRKIIVRSIPIFPVNLTSLEQKQISWPKALWRTITQKLKNWKNLEYNFVFDSAHSPSLMKRLSFLKGEGVCISFFVTVPDKLWSIFIPSFLLVDSNLSNDKYRSPRFMTIKKDTRKENVGFFPRYIISYQDKVPSSVLTFHYSETHHMNISLKTSHH